MYVCIIVTVHGYYVLDVCIRAATPYSISNFEFAMHRKVHTQFTIPTTVFRLKIKIPINVNNFSVSEYPTGPSLPKI